MRKPQLFTLLICIFIIPFNWADTPNFQIQTEQQPTDTVWEQHRARSEYFRQLDKNFITQELLELGQTAPTLPKRTKEFGFDTNQPLTWFKSASGKRIMEIILSFQTPSGGWSKRTDMSYANRKPGQAFGVEEEYIPTFDNSATSTQLMLLAKAFYATGDERYRSAFSRGLDLIILAQYPNGGWPQNFPLTGDYHNHITYNDALMRDLMVVLHKVTRAKNEFAFVTAEQQLAAQQSLALALDCVIKTQVISNRKLTIWGAQHDARTLQPAKARAYEMISLASAESIWLLDFLMEIERPNPELIRAIHAAAKWYEQNKIVGKIWRLGDSHLRENKNAEPLWARFYEIETNKPIFGDRDGSIHYDISEISTERRKGYAWYTTAPNKVLKKYFDWAKRHPQQ